MRGIEAQARLNLSAEFLDWLDAKRAALALGAQTALQTLAQDPAAQAQATRYAETMFRTEGCSNADVLARLHSSLARLDSPLASSARRALTSCLTTLLEDELSPESFQLYLALSLQTKPNLAAAQVALNLSPQAGAACLGELRRAELIDAEQNVTSRELAAFYFENHSEQRVTLLRSLINSTPAEQAFPVFQALFEVSHTFGGVGYWEKAQVAYFTQASTLADAQDFEAVAHVLGQFQEAETDSQRPPHPESRALQAYALARLGRYQQGLVILESVGETAAVLVVKATLLLHTGHHTSAQVLASRLEPQALDACAAWVQALGANLLGRTAYDENRLLDAEAAFAQAAVQWQLAGQPQFGLGMLSNRANVLYKLGRFEDAETSYQEVLAETEDDVLRVRVMTSLGDLYGSSGQLEQKCQLNQEALTAALESGLPEREPTLVASVRNNLGYSLWQLGRGEAHEHLEQALSLSQKAGERGLFARTLANLALVERDVHKLEVALELMEQLGDNHELEIYRKRYETLLIERWLAYESNDDLRSLLFVSQRLGAHYQTHPEAAETGVTANLDLLLSGLSCDEARTELEDYFAARVPPSRAVLA